MVGSRRAQAKLEFDPASSEHGTLLTRQLLEASLKRGNIPSGIGDHMFRQHRPDAKTRLWAVDCIMERQTIPHFLEFLASGRLPNGEQCALPRPTEDEIAKMTIPFSAWAPAPYNENRQPAIEAMMMRTASTEDPWRLFTISKELHAMKSRVWEGIMPLSERRWKNLKLDEPDNFHAACQFIAAVTQVFHYLNHPEVKKALRATFNLISAEFRMYGDAINAQRAISGTDGPNPRLDVSNLWYEFIKAHYDFMTTTAHHWVVEHIDRLREPIMQELEDHQPEVPGPHDERQWALTNKLHDLLENGSHADYAITLPMDGYNGGTLAVQDRVPLNARDRRGFREEPITWNAHTNRRKLDYSGRLRHLSLHEMYKDTAAQFRSGPLSPPRVVNNPLNVVCTARSQFTAQAMARQELRGEPKTPGMNLWLKKVKEECGNPEFEWGYVIYQLSYEHSDEQWAEFKTKFEADIANWDQGITDIDDVRSMCKVHWLEGKKLGIEDGDVEAAKK
ncbi:hypothetical protein QQZ08_005712 [Neonectria magnoliae]|uniref:Uncharacterized protein n=1 Tax=Neonectria magnoliae TaxID=2732573 RepID=A0ABR1I434_9HYPO